MSEEIDIKEIAPKLIENNKKLIKFMLERKEMDEKIGKLLKELKDKVKNEQKRKKGNKH